VIELGKARERLRGDIPAKPRRPRLLVSLAWAEELRARIEVGGVNRAALAREHGITRARVTQLLALLSLPDEILEWVRSRGASEHGLCERRLRPLLGAPRRQQLVRMAAMFPSFRSSQRAHADA